MGPWTWTWRPAHYRDRIYRVQFPSPLLSFRALVPSCAWNTLIALPPSSSLLLFVIGLFGMLHSLEVLGLFKVLRVRFRSRGPFLESPENSRRHNSFCMFKTKEFRVTKLCSYFNFYCPYNMWKDQPYRISRSEFYAWLFGLVKFSGLFRNARQELAIVGTVMLRQALPHALPI